MGIEIVHEFYKKQIAYYRCVNKVVNVFCLQKFFQYIKFSI